MKHLYLVDGSGYIFRAFYAVAPLSNRQGLPTNALLGFTRMLLKLLRDAHATHIAVAFDTGAPTFRHALYDQYKANRKECPEELVPQMPYFRKIVQALGIQSLEKAGVEADDIIATLARKFHTDDTKIVIVSGDKDLTQLVTDRIEVWDAMRDIHFIPDVVREKFGVSPSQIGDYLALVGDSSDNVPGAKGIGPKTAQALLNSIGTLEQLLQNPERVEEVKGIRGAKSVRQTLESSVELLRLSRKLVELDASVDPFTTVESIEQYRWGAPDPALAGPLFAELEFPKILSELSIAASPAPAASAEAQEFVIVTEAILPQVAAEMAALPAFAFDTETTALDCLSCELVGISVSWKADQAYFFPLAHRRSPGSVLDAAQVRELLGPIFSNPAIKKFGQNLKFDASVLMQHGYEVNGINFDSMLASYVLNPDRREHGLKALARNLLQVEMVTYDDMVGDAESILDVDLARLAHYACHDAEVSWRLRERLDAMLGERSECSLRCVFEDIEMPLVPILAAMERVGIKTDTALLATLQEEFGSELKTLEQRIWNLAGLEFNLNSPKQLSEVLFEKLLLPTKGLKKTTSGYSTDASALSVFAEEHQIVRDILEYRELTKLKSTYVDALLRLTRSDTGRVHTSFNQAIAATGRLSSSEPNLQNIPIRNARGRRIREVFIAEPGWKLVSADYSQIELRILAHLANDANLQQAFKRGEDIHLTTARDLFGEIALSGPEKSSLRRVAKTINFGIIYGMSAFRLAGELGVPRKQAQQYIDNYFARYPRVLAYFEDIAASAQQRGYVETLFGRRRYLKDIDTTGRDAGYAGRSLQNAPIQGTAAEVIKLAMIRLFRTLNDFPGQARLVLQVHDELVVEARDEVVDAVKAAVVDSMESAVALSVPLRADIRVGASWGALA